MSLEDLSRQSHESVEQLRHWQALELIGSHDDSRWSDTERIRLIQFAQRRGISPEAIAEVTRQQGDVLQTFVDLLVQTTGKRESQPRDEALAAANIDADFAARAWIAAGLSDEPEIYEDDLEALPWMDQARQGGFPDEAIIQLLRVYTDALSRVAEAENRL